MAGKSSGPVLSEAARDAMSDPGIVGPQLDALLEGAAEDPLVLSHLGSGIDPIMEGAVTNEQPQKSPPSGGDPKEGEPEEEEGGEEEAGEAEEELSEGDPATETGEEESAPAEDSPEEATEEGEGELSEPELKLRQSQAENAALKALLEGGDIEIDVPAPPTTQPATQPTTTEPVLTPQAPPTQVAELSAEEHAEIINDPAKFQAYTQNLVAMAEQRAMAIVPSIAQDLMRTEREVDKFFSNPENADITNESIQQYVVKFASKLQGAGPNVTVTGALEAAAAKVREKIGLPVKSTLPKKKIENKKTPSKGKGEARKFASPTSRRATSATSEGEEKSKLQKQLDILDADE